jgi:hypothetical protein
MKWLTCILLLCYATVFCQERSQLVGKITAGEYLADNVFVINKATGKETKSDVRGLFSIAARVGDQLVVYSDKIEVREFAVNDFSFKEIPYIMEVKPRSLELKEVVINDITPESLGLVPKDQPRYTVAERRLNAAGGSIGLGSGFSISLDYIINVISGRLKMLQQALETEKKEFAMQKIDGIYLEDQIESELKVPAEYVHGFLFFVVEDADFIAALTANNKELCRLLLIDLSKKYNILLSQGGIDPDVISAGKSTKN